MKSNYVLFTMLCLISIPGIANVKAHANLESKSGSTVIGSAEFEQLDNGLQIEYKIIGLRPNSIYGFHIHEKGDCSTPDAKSAGSHYHKVSDSGGTSLETAGAFAGDLPQMTSNDKGIAQGRVTVSNLSLNKINPVDNLAIMVHGGPDDVGKHSAPRIACGLIKPVKK